MMKSDFWRSRGFGLVAGWVLLVLAMVLAFAPVSAEVSMPTGDEISRRLEEQQCGLPIGVVFPIAGTPLWELQRPDVGPCLHNAYNRIIASVCLLFIGTALILCRTLRSRADDRPEKATGHLSPQAREDMPQDT